MGIHRFVLLRRRPAPIPMPKTCDLTAAPRAMPTSLNPAAPPTDPFESPLPFTSSPSLVLPESCRSQDHGQSGGEISRPGRGSLSTSLGIQLHTTLNQEAPATQQNRAFRQECTAGELEAGSPNSAPAGAFCLAIESASLPPATAFSRPAWPVRSSPKLCLLRFSCACCRALCCSSAALPALTLE